MADSEFEELGLHFDQLPQSIRATTKCYTLVAISFSSIFLPVIHPLFSARSLAHDITPCEDLLNFDGLFSSCVTQTSFNNREMAILDQTCTTGKVLEASFPLAEDSRDQSTELKKPPERRRRKLPEIPKHHQSSKS